MKPKLGYSSGASSYTSAALLKLLVAVSGLSAQLGFTAGECLGLSTIGWGIALVLFVPAGYLMISVHRYFTFRRVFGIDHLDPEFRSLPMLQEGIFRFWPTP